MSTAFLQSSAGVLASDGDVIASPFRHRLTVDSLWVLRCAGQCRGERSREACAPTP